MKKSTQILSAVIVFTGLLFASCGGEITNEEIETYRDSLKVIIEEGSEKDKQLVKVEQLILKAELKEWQKELNSLMDEMGADGASLSSDEKKELKAAKSEKYEHKIKRLQDLKKLLEGKKVVINGLIQELADSISDADTSILKYTRVQVEETEFNNFEHKFQVQGIVEADENILVTSEMPGLVREIRVKEGQVVSKGAIIMILDTDVMRRNLEELRTQYALAEELYKKQKSLWDQKIGSEIQLLQARTQKEALENSMATLKAQMDKANIKAPANGVVDDILPKIGEMVGPQMPVARVVNLKSISVTAEISERYLMQVAKGNPVMVTFPAINRVEMAKITRVGTYINPDNRTFEIGVDLSNPDGVLKPNLLAVIAVTDLRVDSAITVPNECVKIDTEEKNYVFVTEKADGITTALKRTIVADAKANGRTLVTKGLKPGEFIVVEGFTKIVNDQEVEVIKGEPTEMMVEEDGTPEPLEEEESEKPIEEEVEEKSEN